MEKLEAQLKDIKILLENHQTVLSKILDRMDKRQDSILFEIERIKDRVELLELVLKR